MNATRRDILTIAAGAGALTALGGCEKIVSTLTEKLGEDVPDSIVPADGASIDPIHHLLNRAGYGPWPGDVQRVRAMGAAAWIEQQLQPQAISDDVCELRASRCEGLDGPAAESHDYSKSQLRESLARYALLRATYSKRQLLETMVCFWSDHLNINIEKGDCIFYKPWDDRHVIRKHALGKFRDLIRASAVSPAMLVYLDGNHNKGALPEDRPNENYGRELLELHTLGVHGGYTQRDVLETARALTGWRIGTGFKTGDVYFDSREHDQREKSILGRKLPAGQNEKDLDDVVDIVCRHPATARHIATKLVRRFVADEAPEALVSEVAGVFRDTDGDIKRMVQTVLLSDEFKTSAGAKFKPPFRFVVSALRAAGADTYAHRGLIEYLTRMGQGVFQFPTPDGYPDKTSPWLGTLLWRWNFAFVLAGNRVPSVNTPLQKLTGAIGATGDAAPAKFFEHFIGRAPTDDQLRALAEARDESAGAKEVAERFAGLIVASPAFQRY
ncbi:MAG TPA: DUF1800 domain-containing protein [Tepidisphaeraceae bacterium]|jgi:uncharacterized protein (DUF1800 family)|nr:DUF1800 domain-containing protein [Tepidisphaeraceae bacterium]